ncbi:MAG: NAD-dependent DNA ligase LigA [Rariglobus sp.]
MRWPSFVGLGLLLGCGLVGWAQPAPVDGISETALIENQKRLKWLRSEIARHDDLYFKKATPEISDAAYDALKRELNALEKASAKDSATSSESVSTGDDRSGNFATHRHGEPMLGLDKAYAEAELRAFLNRVSRSVGSDDSVFVVEPKFDGIAISITYEQGRLVRAATRGNGREGDDVTENALTIRNMPRRLSYNGASDTKSKPPARVELRGEVYIDYAEFARINSEREEAGLALFANPRNLAAGTLKQKDPADVAARGLKVVFYGYGLWAPGDGDAAPSSQQALNAWLRERDLPRVDRYDLEKGASAVLAAVDRWREELKKLPFPTDGVVVKLDSRAQWLRLGNSAEAPRGAIAYKFPPERVSTRVVGITLQVGRSGVITPVAELEPVELAGSKISRATLHNAADLSRRDVRVGDYVFVEKAGEIIPSISGVDLDRRTSEVKAFVFPSECPSCASELQTSKSGATVYCPSKRCPAQIQRKIEHFVAPAAVGIKGLGPVAIATLVRENKISNVADLYRLTAKDLVDAGVRSEAVAKRLLTEIERSKESDLARFILGLGIPQVGRANAEKLADRFGSLKAMSKATDEQLVDFSPVTRDALLAFLAEDENQRMFSAFESVGVNPQQPPMAAVKGPLTGKTVVLTGTLRGMTRAEATRRLTIAGARVVDSVNSRTDLLVAGDDAGSKLAEANAGGIQVIDENRLMKLLEN